MKKLLSFSIVLAIALSLVFPNIALGQSSRLDDLLAKRESLCEELNEVNSEIGELKRNAALTPESGAIGTIEELFPDKALALLVRDSLAKFSIKQFVTQDDLDSITDIVYPSSAGFGYVSDLTGIGRLRSLRHLAFYNSSAKYVAMLPDELYSITTLNELDVSGSSISTVSDEIGYLTNLEDLNISRTNVSSIPDSIGNLIYLQTLDISYTQITELPDAVYSLNLTDLHMAGLPIL